MLTKEWTRLSDTPPTVSISSSDVLNGSRNNLSYIQLTFSSSEKTNNFTRDDILINKGYLLSFSGSENEYTALLIASEHGTYTVDVPAGSFTGNGAPNEAAQQFVWTKERPPQSKKKSDKDKARMISRILKMGKQSDIISLLTQFRALIANNSISLNEQKHLELFLTNNGNFPRGSLLRILDSLDQHSVANSPMSIHHGIVGSDKLRVMDQLLEDSLGEQIMDAYLVNRDQSVFKDLGYLEYYLNTDFNHLMENSSLVLSKGHHSLVEELLSNHSNSKLVNLLLELWNVKGVFWDEPFGEFQKNGDEYLFPSRAEAWAGIAADSTKDNADLYPLSFSKPGKIFFHYQNDNQEPVHVYF